MRGLKTIPKSKMFTATMATKKPTKMSGTVTEFPDVEGAVFWIPPGSRGTATPNGRVSAEKIAVLRVEDPESKATSVRGYKNSTGGEIRVDLRGGDFESLFEEQIYAFGGGTDTKPVSAVMWWTADDAEPGLFSLEMAKQFAEIITAELNPGFSPERKEIPEGYGEVYLKIARPFQNYRDSGAKQSMTGKSGKGMDMSEIIDDLDDVGPDVAAEGEPMAIEAGAASEEEVDPLREETPFRGEMGEGVAGLRMALAREERIQLRIGQIDAYIEEIRVAHRTIYGDRAGARINAEMLEDIVSSLEGTKARLLAGRPKIG